MLLALLLSLASVYAQISTLNTMTTQIMDATTLTTPPADTQPVTTTTSTTSAPQAMSESSTTSTTTLLPMTTTTTSEMWTTRAANDRSAFVGSAGESQNLQCIANGVGQWIWRVSKGSRVVAYAIGTNHLNVAADVREKLGARFEQVRQRLMFTELDLDQSGAIIERLSNSCLYLSSGDIYSTLTPATAARLRTVLAEYATRGFAVSLVPSMRPLFVSSQVTLLPEGLTVNGGVDALFSHSSCSSSEGLEELSDQCEAATTSGREADAAWESGMLLSAIESAEAWINGSIPFPAFKVQEAYLCGALDGLLAMKVRTCSAVGKLVCDRMLVNRERAMAQRLLCLFDKNANPFGERCSEIGLAGYENVENETIGFAIGVAHLVRLPSEPANLFDLFIDAGYSIERVWPNETETSLQAYQCPTTTSTTFIGATDNHAVGFSVSGFAIAAQLAIVIFIGIWY